MTHGSSHGVNGSQRREPSAVYGYAVCEDLEVDHVIGQAEAVVPDLVGRLGEGDDLGELHEGRADRKAHRLILPHFRSSTRRSAPGRYHPRVVQAGHLATDGLRQSNVRVTSPGAETIADGCRAPRPAPWM